MKVRFRKETINRSISTLLWWFGAPEEYSLHPDADVIHRGSQCLPRNPYRHPALIDSITQAVVKDNPKIAERKGFKNIFVNAPCVVCIAYDTTYDMAQIDCGLLGENIILAAWSKGIGSCCLGSSARWILDSPSAKPYLDRMAFSKNYKLLYCIALGYPDESPEAKPRRQDMIKFMD